MKRIYLFLLIFLIIITCKTDKIVKDIKKGFRYIIPDDMEESPDNAYRYMYDNFITEKGKDFWESYILIAIRHSDLTGDRTFRGFVENDQEMLKTQHSIKYFEEKWIPAGFIEKRIDFVSFQFSYDYGRDTIYQRSVYLKDNGVIYIISMSSKNISSLFHKKNDFFWKNVRVD